jgi:ADP-heptose:LPS heptosyltransferase
MIREIRRRKFDVVIVLHTVSFSFTSAALGLLSGARHRVGSTSEPFGHALSRSFFHLELPLPRPAELATMNEAEHNLYPLRAAGIDTADLTPLIVPGEDNRRWAAGFLGEPRLRGAVRMVIHPGAGKIANIWPQERFAEAVNQIAGAVPLDLTVIEGPRDAEAVGAVCAGIATPARILRGRPIGDVAAVLQQADLVLCNDTGVMHVACAAGARTLAVFGPTDPHRWAPRCENLTIVRAEGGDLSELTAQNVSERALELLDAASRKG